MSRRPVLPVRSRRSLTAITAAALVVVGLTTAPSATAAANPTVSVSPATLTPNADATVTVTITGGSANNVAAADILYPAGYTVISAGPAATGWSKALGSSPARLLLTVDNQSDKLGDGQAITQTFSVHTPATTGTTTWSVQTWSNKNRSGPTVNVSATATVGNPTQTITFDALSGKTFGDADFTVSASSTGGSGNPITFTASGTCTATGTNGATIHLTGAGTCTVTANQAGGNGYQAATPVSRSFEIAKADQTISFPSIATPTFGDAPVTLTATAPGGAVTYTATGSCSVSGAQLSFTGGGACTVRADQAGNDDYNPAPQAVQALTVNKAGAVLALDDLTHVYDGTAQGASVTTTPAGLSAVEVTYDGSSTVPTDVGSYAVVATLDNADYSGTVSGTLVITPKHITGAFTVAGRAYDGTTAASVTDRSLNGVVGGDDVTLAGGTATFSSKNAGLRSATLSGASLSGTDAGNYELDGVDDTTATITPAPVTATIMAGDKEYDGDDSAEIQDKDITGVFGTDDVDIADPEAHFSDKNVGEDKTVSATIHLVGAQKDNYALTDTTVTAQAAIYAKQLVGSFTAADKTYDGTTGATVSGTSLPGVIGADDVHLVVSNAAFDTAAVGTGKTVTGVLSLDGTAADVANYALSASSVNTATAAITAKTLTGTVTAANKVYDGGTDAVASPAGLSGVVGDDDVHLVVDSASFGTRNVGNGKTVTAQLSLAGDDASNYSVNPTATAAADVTPAPLTASVTADNKPYDGNRDATTYPSLDGVIGDDDVDVHAVGLFADKSVGTGKTVTATITIDGSDAGNYSVNPTATTTADITSISLVATVTADDKVYDGTRTATTHPSLSGVLGGDVVTVQSEGLFDDENVGTDKPVTATITIGGTDAGNYTVNDTASTTADVSPKLLDPTWSADTKTYDGTKTATVTKDALAGVIGDDEVGFDVTAEFGTKNVGTNKLVTGVATLTGPDSSNYAIDPDAQTESHADITAKSLTGSFTAADKVYDGTRTATVSGSSLPGVIGEDDVTLEVTNPLFDTKNVGTGKTVSAGLALSGAQAGNYSLTSSTATTTANVTKRTVNWSFTAANKVWDGTTSATVTGGSLTDALPNDAVSLALGTATFDTPAVGSSKTVTAGSGFGLFGADAGNYELAGGVHTTTAAITYLYSSFGFYAPVDGSGVYNTVKGGSTVPLKFELFTASGEVTDVAAIKTVSAQKISCTAGVSEDAIETLASTGGTNLRYDTTAGQFIQNWKTPTGAGTCYRASITAQDGAVVTALFKIK